MLHSALVAKQESELSQEALERVKVPAIGLIVTGGLGILGGIANIVMFFVMPNTSSPGMPEWVTGPAFNIGLSVVSMGLSVLVILGGMRMRNLEAWGLSMAASIVAIIPCFVCCFTGIPFGIWAVIVLLNDEVKRSFR